MHLELALRALSVVLLLRLSCYTVSRLDRREMLKD